MNIGINCLALKERQQASGTEGEATRNAKRMAPVTAWSCSVRRDVLRASQRLWF